MFSHILTQLNSLANFNCTVFDIFSASACVNVECVQLWVFVTPWTAVHQAPLSMGFSSQEYWRALPFPPPGDLPNSGIEPMSPASPTLADQISPPRSQS